jgi:hypothetical protein
VYVATSRPATGGGNFPKKRKIPCVAYCSSRVVAAIVHASVGARSSRRAYRNSARSASPSAVRTSTDGNPGRPGARDSCNAALMGLQCTVTVEPAQGGRACPGRLVGGHGLD